MKTRITTIIVISVALLCASVAFGALGVLNTGDRGTAVVQIADVTLQCTAGGTADSNCSMPNDNATWSISENSDKVQFVIHYKFTNQRPVLTQRFTVGYRVWKQDGSNWTLVADKAGAVDRTVSANSNIAGDCQIPAQKLDKSGGTFKVMIKYDTSDVKTDYATRVLTVDRVL